MLDVTSSSSATLNKSTSESTARSMSQNPVHEKRRNYRFYAGDPAIHPADKRLYANGDFEGTPLHVSGSTDPRNVARSDRGFYDLPVPKFKLDRCWVAPIPAKEVTFRNLNDNITKVFLTDMCKRFGDIEDCKIYYDRQTKKHLGLGTVIFKTTKAARECVNALHLTTKMGCEISVSLETCGQERTKQYATLIRAQEQEKAAQEKALAASAAASPPPAIEINVHKSSDRSHSSSQYPVKHRVSNHVSQSSRSSKYPSSGRYDSRGHHTVNDHSEQFSFDPYGSFGQNSNSHKSTSSSSRRSHYRSHSYRSHSQQHRRRRKTSSSATSSSSSRSSSSSSTSSHSSSTSRSYSRSSSSSSRSSYSSNNSHTRRRTSDSRTKSSKNKNDDEDHRPSLDERIAALFPQQQTTNPSSQSSSKTHHRPLPSPNVPPPSHFPYPPPPLGTPLTNVVGSHHHQQSYGVVNNFNFFGNSFPPASFLNSTGGTNWQDMFKQPPPSSSSSSTTITTTMTTINNSGNGFQPYATDNHDERERKTKDLTTAVTNIVSGELGEILRRDLAKKLIETLVYKSIETWYDTEERKEKIRKIKSAETSTHEPTHATEQSNALHHSISQPLIERMPDETPSPTMPQTAPAFHSSSSSSSTNLSTYFEHMRDSIGSSVRTQMPKIPSFKKRTIPEEKPVIPQKVPTPVEKKELPKQQQQTPSQQQQRKPARKRISSTSSESNGALDNDESHSRDSITQRPDEPSSLETKLSSKPSVDQPTPEEEEGEIKDEDEHEDIKTSQSETEPLPLPPPPVPSPTKKSTNKSTSKQPKKPGAPKKRKIEQIKIESTQENDDLDNSTLAKRKKSVTNIHLSTTTFNDNSLPQTVNLLDSLPEQVQTASSVTTTRTYNPFAYIEFEHDYAIMTRQPVLIAKRLTVDGLNNMGVQAPMIDVPKPKFPPREHDAEMRILYELDQGVDEEDIAYLKQSFQKLCEEGHSCTTQTRWVDYPPTRDSVLAKSVVEKHRTGCARTEGYYKIIKDEKFVPMKTPDGSQISSLPPQTLLDNTRTTGAQMSRELRSEHRRNLLALGDVEFADHFKFSQLKLRKKRLRYAKSSIHAWGLFACEHIASEDMVIEYVGETIRQSVGDLREKQYELEGMNSNYMFRVDSDTIVDATKCGNLARFINHSCDPNCYAKIIPVESQKKIVIYSKRDIRLGEEITYDYKFPLEEQKIPCRCGTPACRGSLN